MSMETTAFMTTRRALDLDDKEAAALVALVGYWLLVSFSPYLVMVGLVVVPVLAGVGGVNWLLVAVAIAAFVGSSISYNVVVNK